MRLPDTLREIQKLANGRIKILAGSGVNSQNAAEIIRETGVNEVHSSCKHTVENPQKTNIEDSSRYMETDLEEVKGLLETQSNQYKTIQKKREMK